MSTNLFRFFVLLLPLSVLLGLSSCDPDPVIIEPTQTSYGAGLFISNEGPFISGTGTLTYYDPLSGKVSQTIYQKANEGKVLGNILQSMAFFRGNAYLVINNANTVVVADASTFEDKGKIAGLELPRFFLGIDDSKAYVSQWGSTGTNSGIAVVDLQSNAITKQIPLGQGSERMLLVGGLVYVVNEGGFGRDSMLSVIDPAIDEVLFEVEVGENPTSLVAGADGSIWTIGRGYTANWYDPNDPANISGQLCNVLADGSAKSCISIPMGATDLVIDGSGTWVYFVANSQIFRYPTDGSQTVPELFYPGYFYELYWDTSRDLLLAADALDFSNPGKVLEIDAQGNLVGSFETGIVPGYIVQK